MTDQKSSKSGGDRQGAQQMRSPGGREPFRPGAQRVRIQIGKHYAQMTPGLANVVGPLLQSTTPYFSQGGPNGYRQHAGIERYFVITNAGQLRFPAGLVPRVVSFLRQQDYQVTVTDRTSWTQFDDADMSLLESSGLDSDDKMFLDAIRQNPLGQIHLRRQDDVARHIGLLGDFHPKANIAIVTANLEQAKRLFARLKQHTDRLLALSPQIIWGPGRTFICPVATFGMFSPRDWDVLIFVGVEAALGKRAQETLVEMNEQFRYVFLDPNTRIGSRTQLRLEVFFGAVIFQQPAPYGAPAEVNVVFAASPGTKASRKLTGLERKRACFWHDAGRNQAVAGTAEAVERGDVAALEGYGVPASAITTLEAKAQTRTNVSILVESTEHGQQLQKLLPSWHLAHMVPEPAHEGVRFTDCPSAVNHATISTMVYAERHGVVSDVLIRADGGDDWPLSADRFPGRATGAGDIVLVIDLADHVGGRVTSSLKRRVRAYERLGWRVQAVPKVHEGARSRVRSTPEERTAGKKHTSRHKTS